MGQLFRAILLVVLSSVGYAEALPTNSNLLEVKYYNGHPYVAIGEGAVFTGTYGTEIDLSGKLVTVPAQSKDIFRSAIVSCDDLVIGDYTNWRLIGNLETKAITTFGYAQLDVVKPGYIWMNTYEMDKHEFQYEPQACHDRCSANGGSQLCYDMCEEVKNARANKPWKYDLRTGRESYRLDSFERYDYVCIHD